jgi:hypothetical protein
LKEILPLTSDNKELNKTIADFWTQNIVNKKSRLKLLKETLAE